MEKSTPVFSGAVNLPPANRNERRGATVGTLKLYESKADLERFPSLPPFNGYIIIENPKKLKVRTDKETGKETAYLYVSVWEKQ
jgi:hypothetical protein